MDNETQEWLEHLEALMMVMLRVLIDLRRFTDDADQLRAALSKYHTEMENL